ncbi:MAG: epoxyqueuosine reductase [Thermodesulfobacteriota bacterium]
MVTRQEVMDKAIELGFEDVGFATAEPFAEHREILQNRQEEYGWAEELGLELVKGTDPANSLPGAKSIVVLLENYYKQGFPRWMEGHFGRCYLDDDRVTKDGLSRRIKELRKFFGEHGIDTKVPFNLPHRAAAARAGLGTFGKNCLLYANRVARGSSFVLPVAVVVDTEFEPDASSIEYGCPEWCRSACIAACPTKALKGNGTIDPRKCISYLTYLQEDITPLQLREPMGINIFGCDRCQEVCPRNAPWFAQDLPINPKVAAKEEDFELGKLLRMDREYFENRIWPHMFYISPDDLWKWKMNVARAMGNTCDRGYVSGLIRAFRENSDERVKGMIAWSLGKLGGKEAKEALSDFYSESSGLVREEIERAIKVE